MVTGPLRRKLAVMRIACALAILGASVPARPAQLLFARGDWAALRFDSRCEARSRALSSSGQAKPRGYLGFAFDSAGGIHGQFYVHLSRSARPGSAVIATVHGQPFLLVARSEWAWARSPEQSLSIIAAARLASGIRVTARDGGGRGFTDRYGLAGAPTAIDAAAAACAGKWG
jgi:hypothetical protein